MAFDKSNLETLFSNVGRVANPVCENHYTVFNAHGSTVAQIMFQRGHELVVEVDNFPGQKLYYSSALPIRSVSEFVSDMQRAGIELAMIEGLDLEVTQSADSTIQGLRSAVSSALTRLRRMLAKVEPEDEETEQFALQLAECHDELKLLSRKALGLDKLAEQA